MAPTSSDIASTSASNEITEENSNQIQNHKVNVSENGVKPGSESLPQDSSKKKPPSFFTWGLKTSKNQEPPKGKGLKLGGETKETLEEARKKEEEEQVKKHENDLEKREDIEKEIKAISRSISADIYSITNASKRIKEHDDTLEKVTTKFDELKKNPNVKDLREFKKVVKTLKQQISSHDKKNEDNKEKEALLTQLNSITGVDAQAASAAESGIMPNLFTDPMFEKTLAFQDFKALYNELPLELKLCLLCFSVFPENVVIKRRVIIYWWIGEGFVPPRKDRPEENTNNQQQIKFNLPSDKEFTTEQWANHYFKVLLDMGFIESAQRKPNPKVDTCKMHPFVRSMVNRISQDAAFFDFDKDGSVSEEFCKSFRACLLHGNALKTDNDKLLKNLHAVLNVDEEILDFKQDSLSKMKNANVLYLGRWQSSGTHHIEVDDSRILDAKKGNPLDGLRNMKNLKFLSLQGISRIIELPKSIMKLENLTILDIRACHNLEKIPNGIGRLVNLIRLDMSECPLLNEMPKGISKLTKLQVLSGFVVLEPQSKSSCTLADLKALPDLRKLSIHTGSDDFPKDEDLQALNKYKKLSKLTIGWGRGSGNTKEHKMEKSTTTKKDNNEESKQKGSKEVSKEGKEKGKEQTPKRGNEEENTKGQDTGNQDNDWTLEKVSKEGKEKGKEQTPKKGNEEKNTKGQDTGNQDNDRTLEKVGKEGKGKGIVSQSTEITENSQETVISDKSRKHDKGKVDLFLGLPEKDVTKNHNTEKQPDSSPFSSEWSELLSRAGEPSKKKSPSMKKSTSFVKKTRSLVSFKSSQRVTDKSFELPSQLTKLDLQCSPEKLLKWLSPSKLRNLEKLYIRGGKLSNLGQYQDFYDESGISKWDKVKELRLKYLDELEMDWRELLELFPKMDYLEKVDCPKLSFFPCDEVGVWTKKKTIS